MATSTRTLSTLPDTLRFGRVLGSLLTAGDLVILSGSLGAGKTALTKGIAVGMGVSGLVTSPTFVLARVHAAGAGGVSLVHVDAYRLAGSVELDDLDLDTDLTAAAVVVEWGEGVAERLSQTRLTIALERLPDDSRMARIEAAGSEWERRLPVLLAG
ncbi:tRNA threonylcarbamoyladenosine biosynthesis protein TsaE [Nakamurella sp. UYEF19]